MRRIHRGPLDFDTLRELHVRQKTCTDVATAQAAWKAFRQQVASRPILEELKRMGGSRQRCYYCSDSHGADVEHFAPVSPNYGRTFRWTNLLLVCTKCNRKKGNRFPGSVEAPLLIDPTVDDPWRHFILETKTGVLAPRFTAAGPDPRAAETLKILDVLLDEAVAEGRVETIERIREAAETCVEPGADLSIAGRKLLKEVRRDYHGVTTWFTRWEGRNEDPFPKLRNEQQALWRRVLSAAVVVEQGVRVVDH